MPHPFPRSLIRKLESEDLPLEALQAVRDLRRYLETVEEAAILRAQEVGATPTDIAHALSITRQGVYHKLRLIEARKHRERTVVVPEPEPQLESERRDRQVDVKPA